MFRLPGAQVRCEHHYFAISANNVLGDRDWVLAPALCAKVDLTMLDEFSRTDIRDLRNMREHAIDYFIGSGITRTAGLLNRRLYPERAHLTNISCSFSVETDRPRSI